jgi:hypothetical protein
MSIILKAIPILEEYFEAGYRMTLRQLHYQFVAHHDFPNTDKSYNKICVAMKRGRMQGLIDWLMIEDRTRFVRTLPNWNDPADIVDACANQFHVDFWKNQASRVEVWIEKDALIGVVENTCNHWDCPILSCRGYLSTSELHEAALRIKRCSSIGQGFTVLYCGDHDPSGLNMGDVIMRTLNEFGAVCQFNRIALNIEQIKQFNLPPNPVKDSDKRTKRYRELYGSHCWELDALTPKALNELIETAIIASIDDMDDFDCRREEDIAGREQLDAVSSHFSSAYQYVKDSLCDDESTDGTSVPYPIVPLIIPASPVPVSPTVNLARPCSPYTGNES